MPPTPPTSYPETGYAVVRGLYDAARTSHLLTICNRILEQWRAAPLTDNPPVGPRANYMRHLNHPGYHEKKHDDLAFLLDAAAEPALLDAARNALAEEIVFHSISLFFNPSGEDMDGEWHKDKGHEERDPPDVLTGPGVQVQAALEPSDDLQYVPGSHLRDYSDEERRICLDDDGRHKHANDMPDAIRIALEPGDAALFNPDGIHRGSLHAVPLRRTLMFTFQKTRLARERLAADGLNQYSDQPWFLLPGYLDGVRDDTRAFFQSFVDFYGPRWRAKLSELLKYRGVFESLAEKGIKSLSGAVTCESKPVIESSAQGC